MSQLPTPTPEFLIWALELRCDLREIEGFEQPERTDRQLRAVRAVSDARFERREVAGLCVATSPRQLAIPSHAAFAVEESTSAATAGSLPQAFRVSDALLLFGDEAAVEKSCRGCRANAEERANPASWAGCYGMLPLPSDAAAFHAAFDEAARSLSNSTPAWYGLWLEGPVSASRAAVLQPVVEQVADELRREPAADVAALEALARGLATAATAGLAMHVSLYPRGQVLGRWWHLEPSCPRCHATLAPPATRCPVCSWAGRQGTPPKRRSRGTRPYRPLREIVSEATAEEVLRRLALS